MATGNGLDLRIEQIALKAAREVAELVRAEIALELQRIVGSHSSVTGTKGKGAAAARSTVQTTPSGRKSPTFPPHCLSPGCTAPHRGSKFSFLCAEHMGIAKAEKKKLLADWKASGKTGPVPKNGTAAKTSTTKSGRPGRRGLDEATLKSVLGVIESTPGLRSEQIYKKLPLNEDLARKALAKLRETKRVRTKGEKRAMTYAAA
jgi:hypothetical protein